MYLLYDWKFHRSDLKDVYDVYTILYNLLGFVYSNFVKNARIKLKKMAPTFKLYMLA